MAERAGFEPDNRSNDTSDSHEKSSLGPLIGPLEAGACRHCESCPVADVYPEDLREVIDAWPELSCEIKSAVWAIVRSSY